MHRQWLKKYVYYIVYLCYYSTGRFLLALQRCVAVSWHVISVCDVGKARPPRDIYIDISVLFLTAFFPSWRLLVAGALALMRNMAGVPLSISMSFRGLEVQVRSFCLKFCENQMDHELAREGRVLTSFLNYNYHGT